jgi:hypothetical protein
MGVSNFQFGWIDSSMIFFFGYDFQNLDVLNELQISSYLNNRKTLTREDIGDFKYFELKGKNTLTYNHLVEDSLGFKNDKSQKRYKMFFIFKFDRKTKKSRQSKGKTVA